MFITRVAVSIVVNKTNKKLTQYKLSFFERSQVIGQFYLHQSYQLLLCNHGQNFGLEN